MTNGWLIAAAADGALGAELAAGFELELMRPGPPEEREAALAQLAEAANVGVLVSNLAANDDAFVALVRLLAGRRAGAQIILAEPEARALFPFLPDTWPVLPLEEALRRARLAASRRAAPLPPTAPIEPEPPVAAPPPHAEAEPPPLIEPEPEPAPLESRPDEDVMAAPQDEPVLQDIEPSAGEAAPEDDTSAVDALSEESFEQAAPAEREQASVEHFDLRSEQIDEAKRVAEAEEQAPAEAAEPPEVPPSEEAPSYAPPPAIEEPAAPPQSANEAPAPARKSAAPDSATESSSSNAVTGSVSAGSVIGGVTGGLARQAQAPSAPADATAFAPKKLRRGEAELVRISIHQPKDLQAVIKAARQADPRTTPAPQSMGIGEVALGASVGVSLEVRGAACDGALQRRTWTGSPLEFSFAVEADPDVRQVVILARVFVDDAQIGVLAFTRGVTGPKPKPLSDGERVRLKRHKRVFLSYSSRDRETVSAIATAYEAAGIPHFWDRSSLKSGEEWHPRLRREIDRCDLFHLCWSKSAATSEWVEKEAAHALGLRRRTKRPDITVQMLDGPPWAKHPDSLDSINFDDFVRAAIVGYARGDGAD